ncbi:MAG: hypothetical protein ACD_79C00243G0001 [uncultured bacterium]|nr:MAG: hypothetical protein ACD_79C00243G0001 [uncultured bacterium]
MLHIFGVDEKILIEIFVVILCSAISYAITCEKGVSAEWQVCYMRNMIVYEKDILHFNFYIYGINSYCQ